MHLKLTDEAKSFIAEEAYDPHYGARPVNRYLQKNIETQIASMIIKGDIVDGQTVVINSDGSRLEISAMVPPVFCTKKDFFVQSIRNPAGKSKDSDNFSAQRQVHHRFGTVGGVLPEHCRAAMGGGDLLHYI